jgi:hypothetical protein
MSATFQNSAMVLSIGIFFTLMIIGLAANLPSAMHSGLVAHGVPNAAAARISHLPPVSTLFSALLGYNPMQTLLTPGGVLHSLQLHHAAQAQLLTGRGFFPQLISDPFHSALGEAFTFALIACLVAAVASLLRGGKYHWTPAEETVIDTAPALPDVVGVDVAMPEAAPEPAPGAAPDGPGDDGGGRLRSGRGRRGGRESTLGSSRRR